MNNWTRFEDMKVWQDSRSLVNRIYQGTNTADFSKDYGLKDQIRRAAVSTLSNIAEGYEREGQREFLRFLHIAKGSCGEVRAQLYVARDLGYIQSEEFMALHKASSEISRQLAGLIRYFKQF